MEDQDEFLIRKSECKEVGLETNNKAALLCCAWIKNVNQQQQLAVAAVTKISLQFSLAPADVPFFLPLTSLFLYPRKENPRKIK